MVKQLGFFLVILCLFLHTTLSGQISYWEGNYEELFAEAEIQDKSILLYFNFDQCGACKQMDSMTLSKAIVSEYFDEKYISYSVNTRTETGIEINRIHKIRLHPTFLFLNAKGKVMHKIVGVFSPEQFIAHGKSAISQNKSLEAMKEDYKNGRRDADFLYEYCRVLNDANELTQVPINEYLDTQKFEDLSKQKNLGFIYEFIHLNFETTVDLDSDAFQFLYRNKELFYASFDKEQVNTRIVLALNGEIYAAIQKRNEHRFNYLIKLIEPFDKGKIYYYKETDVGITAWTASKHLVLSAKLNFYKETRQQDKFEQSLAQYIEKIWDDHEELNSIAWEYFEEFDNHEKLKNAETWAKRSVEISPNFHNLDTYASILYKLAKYEKAKTFIDKALTLGVVSGANIRQTEALKKKILKKIND